jgi:hypothetical protein
MNKHEAYLIAKTGKQITTSKLPIGSRVMIASASVFCIARDSFNPIGVPGTIVLEAETNEYYKVDWDNGRSNTYEWEDLILVPDTYIHD